MIRVIKKVWSSLFASLHKDCAIQREDYYTEYGSGRHEAIA